MQEINSSEPIDWPKQVPLSKQCWLAQKESFLLTAECHNESSADN